MHTLSCRVYRCEVRDAAGAEQPVRGHWRLEYTLLARSVSLRAKSAVTVRGLFVVKRTAIPQTGEHMVVGRDNAGCPRREKPDALTRGKRR